MHISVFVDLLILNKGFTIEEPNNKLFSEGFSAIARIFAV
jgi:hypothetical protein